MISVFGYTIIKNEKLEELQSQNKKSLELLNKKDKWIADLLNEALGYFLPYADHPLSMAESKEWSKILSRNIRLANSYIEERKKELQKLCNDNSEAKELLTKIDEVLGEK